MKPTMNPNKIPIIEKRRFSLVIYFAVALCGLTSTIIDLM